MKKTLIIAVLVLITTLYVQAQLKVVSVQKIPLPARFWMNPTFSPDGQSLFVTMEGYSGIWQYSLKTRQTKRITPDAGAGFGFAISPDNSVIAYRRNFYDQNTRNRTQEIVETSLISGRSVVRQTGPDLSLPVFSGERIVSVPDQAKREEIKTASIQSVSAVKVIGIERAKILLLAGDEAVRFDPYGNGSYIWPSLSPDGTRVLSYEMSRGAFVCDLDGRILVELGRRNAPVWSWDGRWIFYMDDRDDGHNIISSDIYAVSADGARTVRLTSNDAMIELHPSPSPVENKIAFHTLDGTIYMLEYKETQQ